MDRQGNPIERRFLKSGLGLTVLALAWAVFSATPLLAQKAKFQAKKPPVPKPLALPPPKSALLTVEDWQKVPMTPLGKGEIDQLIRHELDQTKVVPAALTSDEQFIRRATLDLTGELPLPADVNEFVADKETDKRAKLVDKLLASEEYASHWASYWREVFAARLTERRFTPLANSFEAWLVDEFKANRGWDRIVRAMITAEGQIRFDEPGKNGAAFFLAAHRGVDAANERAAETSRVFLGIQIQCAQCHDHPSDQWKRVQFHELAGYYARLNERPVREGKMVLGFELVPKRQGEHEMPSKEDPKKGFLTNPRFLDGKGPRPNLPDHERRQSLAEAVVNKSNYWFAGAYVNRIWGELMGQSFYQPVDDMGPKKEVVFAAVLTRLTGSFRGTNYDVKRLFREIMTSATYQRQIRLDGSTDQHLHFAAAYPTRLHADALWQSLESVLGTLPGSQKSMVLNPKMQAKRGPQGLEAVFKEEFGFDPSLKADEVEGSVTQALMLMNNPAFNQRIQARGANLLARILKSYPDDEQAVRMVYLRTLARTPTEAEMKKCREYIGTVANRTEAFEDLLWAMLNSTEFQTKR